MDVSCDRVTARQPQSWTASTPEVLRPYGAGQIPRNRAAATALWRSPAS